MKGQIKIGIGLGLWYLGLPSADSLVRVATRAEEWGVDSFRVPDHLQTAAPDLDVVALLALLAAHTSSIKLGPSVLLLNLRNPIMAAKSFAALDYLSKGRMVMAVGTGANLKDYALAGITPSERGRRLDEGIEVLRALWRGPQASFHGRFYNFDNLTLEPRPMPRRNNDSGTMDIWVGGQSEGALRRTARLADGFFASSQTPEDFARNLTAIRQYAADYGRANARIEAGIILFCRLSSSIQKARDEMQTLLAPMGPRAERILKGSLLGSVTDIARRIDEYAAAGLDKFVLMPLAAPDQWVHQVELIGKELAAPYLKRAVA